MYVSKLSGHSGCELFLSDDNGKIFVRKVSRDVAYNDRLKLQAQKQNNYAGSVVKTPIIYSQGYTDSGLFYFDMEYVQGIVLAEYIKTIEIGRIYNCVDTILNGLIGDKKKIVNNISFVEKIVSLSNQIIIHNKPTLAHALNLLKNHDWKFFEPSFCHGDLTLENIIVKNEQFYLIDFLDSFYNCWLLDIGAIMQDVFSLWYYRRETELDVNTKIRLIVFRDILIDIAKKRLGDAYIEIYYALLLKLLRMYPYMDDSCDIDFLDTKIQTVVSMLDKEV